MIHANELRIGNYLHFYKPLEHEKQIGKVRDIFEEDEQYFVGIDVYAAINLPSGVMGIPLTPERLERCGFVKRINPTNVQCESDLGDYTVFVCFDREISIWIDKKEDEDFPNSDDAGIQIKGKKYVHELQNLCFPLTGEELQIKFE